MTALILAHLMISMNDLPLPPVKTSSSSSSLHFSSTLSESRRLNSSCCSSWAASSALYLRLLLLCAAAAVLTSTTSPSSSVTSPMSGSICRVSFGWRLVESLGKGGGGEVGGQAVLGRQQWAPTPWLPERHRYDPTFV